MRFLRKKNLQIVLLGQPGQPGRFRIICRKLALSGLGRTGLQRDGLLFSSQVTTSGSFEGLERLGSAPRAATVRAPADGGELRHGFAGGEIFLPAFGGPACAKHLAIKTNISFAATAMRASTRPRPRVRVVRRRLGTHL